MQPEVGTRSGNGMVRRVRPVGTYDADAPLTGGLCCALAKLTGPSRCTLCDITHGWNPLGIAGQETAGTVLRRMLPVE